MPRDNLVNVFVYNVIYDVMFEENVTKIYKYDNVMDLICKIQCILHCL